jgi:hypothetical protein
MSTGSSAQASPSQSASRGKTQSVGAESAGDIQSPAEGIEKLQSALDHLASLDRKTLALEVLNGSGTNFPGRSAWEERLFAAKQTFVAQTRSALEKAKEIAAAGQGFKDAQDMNDPRVKGLAAKLEQLVQETQSNAAAFHSVIEEGRALAGLPDAQ